MNRFPLLLLIQLSLLLSCENDKPISTNHRRIEINLTDAVKFMECSEIMHLNRFVNLETNEKCLIGGIDKVLLVDTFLYVLDREITKSLYVFNDKGRFIKKLSSQGKGPREYLSLSDVVYDKWMNKLFVLDRGGAKLLVFNLTGDLLDVVNLDDGYSFLRVLDKDKFVFYSNYTSHKNKQFTISLKNGEIVKAFRDVPPGQMSYGYSHDVFCKSSDSCLFSLPLDNKIYKISNKDNAVFASLEFSGKFIDTIEVKKLPFNEIIKIIRKDTEDKIITQAKDLMLVDHMLYFSFVYLYNEYSLIYDLKDERVVDCGVLLPDSDHLFIGDRTPVGQTCDELIFTLNPFENMSRYKRLKSMTDYRAGLKKYQGVFENKNTNQESNPSLLLFKINK